MRKPGFLLSRAALALAIALIGSALIAIPPAAAQRTGTRIGSNATAKDAEQALDIVAKCMAERKAGYISELLKTLPGSEQEFLVLKRNEADIGICMDSSKLVMDGKELAFAPNSLRPRLLLFMVRNVLRRKTVSLAPAADTKPWFEAELATLAPEHQYDAAVLMYQDFGHCVVVRKWTAAQALVVSERGSAEEKAAVAALVPVLGPCLAEGVTTGVTATTLRLAIAEPLYHLLTDPVSPAKRDATQP